MTDVLFLSIAFAGLAALGAVLVLIGRAAAECPQTRGAARLGTMVVTTGFSAIGSGVLLIIAAILPILIRGSIDGLYVALGIAAIALGIGFYSAATMLRDILKSAQAPGRSESGAAAS